ncbi:hypothetical protein NQ315_007621 [Exocentrus adspersus]|uniref:Ras-related protein Rab n=1 Tax=Exocentrus adspersus TaxID=1586481 RepID=A0AAV8W7N9_9CUCU|nr:hypothetical protein NQ315_007621 [Exocentrus adspersus]
MTSLSNGITREKILSINDSLRINNLHKRELNFKFVIIGDFGVGKTSIIGRYTEGQFSTSYKITIGADFALKTLEWDEDTRVNLHLWDIAGHERFGSLTGVFYRHAVAAAIVFDLTRPETYSSVEKWLIDLRRKVHLPGGLPIPVVILANKGDVTVTTLPSQIEDFCKANNILSWFITSAKNNLNIDEAMIRLTNAAIQNHHNLQFPLITDDIISLTDASENNEKMKKCC